MKLNQTIKYVSKLSNHPQAVTKNLPKNINNRFRELEKMLLDRNYKQNIVQAAIKKSF